nr:MAG TPA: hypothetical protein [Bacteriophage sp.]
MFALYKCLMMLHRVTFASRNKTTLNVLNINTI